MQMNNDKNLGVSGRNRILWSLLAFNGIRITGLMILVLPKNIKHSRFTIWMHVSNFYKYFETVKLSFRGVFRADKIIYTKTRHIFVKFYIVTYFAYLYTSKEYKI